MRIAELKLVLSFCVCAWAYHHGPKQGYIKWRERSSSTPDSGSVVNSANDIYGDNPKLRHHSRFPNLDRVLIGLQKSEPRLRHQQSVYRTTTTDEGLFGDDYADMEYEEEDSDANDYEDWESDDDSADDDNFDNYDEDAAEDDFFNDNDWQAEEATEPPAKISPITKYKWDNFGTRARVEESRRQQLHIRPNNDQRGASAAVAHFTKVNQEVQCLRPRPKVISVQSEHPDNTKKYIPHCTILHRCAEDTGCCSNHETRCGPKTQVPVHLYFYASSLDGSGGTKVEKLTFFNHTECACIAKNKTTTSTENSIAAAGLSLKSSASTPENMRQCRCPEVFTPKFRYGSRCSCECEDDNEACIQMKKGKEHFSMADRTCIKNNECSLPACEYGIYLRPKGRCQQKLEKLDSYRKMTIK